MSFEAEVRHTPSTGADGTTQLVRQSRRGEIISPPWNFQLAAEGKVFYAGDELEATFNDSQAALTDTTPSYILRGPAGTVVMPLSIDLELTAEGGASPKIAIVYIQGDNVVTPGTTIVAYNARGGANQPAAKAVHQLNPTLTAFAANNVIVGGNQNVQDNLLSAGLADTVDHGVALIDMATYRWRPRTPILLTDNGMIAVYLGTGSGDSKYRTLFTWAELDASDVF